MPVGGSGLDVKAEQISKTSIFHPRLIGHGAALPPSSGIQSDKTIFQSGGG